MARSVKRTKAFAQADGEPLAPGSILNETVHCLTERTGLS